MPLGAREVRRRLASLAERAQSAMRAEPLDREAARSIGAELARLGYVRPSALGETLQVLGTELLPESGTAEGASQWPRLAALLGELAAGFSQHVQTTILEEQEAIHLAMLEARRQVERALRESQERFRAIFEGAAIAIAVTDTDGRLINVNPGLQTMLGYSAAELVGQSFITFSHPEDVNLGLEPFVALVSGKIDRYEMEQRFRHKEGADVWAHLAVSIVRDPEGRPLYVIGMGEDITERKRSDAARREAEAEAAALRQLDELKDELLSTISHELRTPLAVVHGYAQRLVARGRTMSADTLESTARSIQASSTQLTLLVSDLLDFSRMQRGDVQVEFEEFDLVPVLHEQLADLRQRPGGERLVGQLPETLPVRGDPHRVVQILVNLVDNALKYAPHGPVVLRSGPSPTASQTVRVEVVDQGPGIPRREQHRVWEKFYRGSDVAGLNRARGTGIGLAVVKALVEAQGGQLGLDSTPGEGATFWFELPAAAGADLSPAA